MQRLGIILAAGQSSRLYPSTLATTKQLLPIYDKPLIYYPLSTLMLADIKNYIIIVSPAELNTFTRLFHNSKEEFGVDITILVQDEPRGIADAFNIVSDYLGTGVFNYDQHVLILGDNIFYGSGLSHLLENVNPMNANIFLYKVQDPTAFGVAEVVDGIVTSVEEKPKNPKSDYAITGLYFYPASAYLYTKMLAPSARGELEITDLNNFYLRRKELTGVQLLRGMVWFDTGTPDSMLEASNFIQNIQKHQGYLVNSPHEIAFNKGWVSEEQLLKVADKCGKTAYGKYLKSLTNRG